MFRLVTRLRDDERGVALVTALFSTMVMLALGFALLSIVDTQAHESVKEKTRDQAFNLSESVLSSQAFVLGRNWPSAAPAVGELTCSHADAGFGDTIGSTAPAVAATQRLRGNLNASSTDPAFEGATWQVNMCDDDGVSTVWNDSLLSTAKNFDKNGNSRIWVRTQATVGGRTRALAGLVRIRSTEALKSKYGLVSGGLTDDLGSTVNTLATEAFGGVLGNLLNLTPTVAADPSLAATTPPSSGVTGLRCGALDLKAVPLSTCLAGTIGAAGALPVVSNLLTGGKIEQFPTTTAASPASIAQLRAQAIATNTYYSESDGAADTTVAGAKPCTWTTNTGTRSADTVVFIEKVGNGNHYCSIDVQHGVRWKALVIGSGRVIIRGNNASTGTPVFATPDVPQANTFSGVVYALNLQRHSAADGGMDLGDSASPGREVVRIDRGAHVKGAVNADGKSAKVGIYPPALPALNMTLLKAAVCNPLPLVERLLCNTLGTVDALLSNLGVGILTNLVNGIVAQLGPPRAQYGSAIVSDVAAIKRVTVHGTAGVVAGTFRDLHAR